MKHWRLVIDLETADKAAFLASLPERRYETLAEVLEEYGVPVALSLDREATEWPNGGDGSLPPGTCWVVCADLSGGFRLPSQDLWLGTDSEVFGRTRVRGRRRRFQSRWVELLLGDALRYVRR